MKTTIEISENEAPAKTRAFQSSRRIDEPVGLCIMENKEGAKLECVSRCRRDDYKSLAAWANDWDGRDWKKDGDEAVSPDGARAYAANIVEAENE